LVIHNLLGSTSNKGTPNQAVHFSCSSDELRSHGSSHCCTLDHSGPAPNLPQKDRTPLHLNISKENHQHCINISNFKSQTYAMICYLGSGSPENEENKTAEVEKKERVSVVLHLQEEEDCAQQRTN